MKRVLSLALGLILAGCSAIPGQAPAEPATPAVVVETVIVTVVPTQAPTEVPTQPPAPTQTPQIIVVTATPMPGSVAGPLSTAAAPVVASGSATATLPANAGGDLFTSLTRSSDHFALRCLPDTITFTVTTANPYVVGVDIYYRIEDQQSTTMSGWIHGGAMESDKHGTFTLAFPSSRVDPDVRSHRAWFDYQFVGVNKTGDAVGRSLRIVKQITYTIDCTD